MTETREMALDLLRVIMGWHCDPCSVDYRRCDISPCPWCKEAGEVIAKHQFEGVKR